VVAVAITVCGVALMLIPPTGCNAVPLAVACLWRWPPPLQTWLEKRLRLGRRALDIVGVGLAAAAAAVSLWTGGQFDGHLFHGGDFQTYWLGATVGTHYGWSRLFDEGIQRTVWQQVGGAGVPFLPFLNTPPTAWLVAPLLSLPYIDAYAIWVSLMTVTAVLVVLLLMPTRWLPAAGLVSLGLWVTPLTLASGQNAALEALAVAATWRLLRSGRTGWAGLALSLVDLRPTATLLVPLALLLAGYRRTFLIWLGVTAALGALTVWLLGTTGLVQFIRLGLEIRMSHPHAQEMTILGWLGPHAFSVALEAVLAASALAAAWRFGRAPELAVAAGVLASLFVTPYIHYQDYVVVIAAAGANAASTVRASFGLVIVAVLAAAPPGWIFGHAWEGALLAVEVAWLVWLVWSKLEEGGTVRRRAPARS
jgi:glycosyl transferase family 87